MKTDGAIVSESEKKMEKTYVKGLEGVVAAETALSLVDGEESKLYYRGIPVHELVEQSSFEETVFLLWNGRLPNAGELEQFSSELASHRALPQGLLDAVQQFPKEAHPMGVLRSLTSQFGLYDAEADTYDNEGNKRKALKLTAAMTTMIAAFYRYREGKEVVAPDSSLSHAANFYYMMHGEKPAPEMEKALDAYLILLADHGLNASTFSARVTSSTQSDMYSAITAAVGTLKGDLHGSANQRAMEMILEIGEPARAEAYVLERLANKEKIMGFGHRVYKKQDPRAVAFRDIAAQMCERAGDKTWMEISNTVEKTVWDQKQIPCNVDFFSASVLYILGFPVDFFTTVFAASRVGGWTAHVIEQLANNRLIRPKGSYTGPQNQHYVPLEERS